MIAIALLCDVFQWIASLLASIEKFGLAFIPLVWVVSVGTFFIFLVWFAVLRVNYLERNTAVRLFTIILAFSVELVPFFNMLPAITFGVIALISTTRYEDGKSGLFVRAKRNYLHMNQAERLAVEHSAQERFVKDQGSLAALRVQKRVEKAGGEGPPNIERFEDAENELKRRRRQNPRIEATLYDAEEEAMMRNLEKQKTRKSNWF